MIAKYALAPDVILVPVPDGSARLLDLGGCFYAIPAPGALILRETLDRGLAAAVPQVTEQFQVSAEQVRQDADEFLQELVRQGLVQRVGPARLSRRPAAVWPYLVVAPLLRINQRVVRSLEARVWFLLALARLVLPLLGWTRTVRIWERSSSRQGGPLSSEERQRLTNVIDRTVRRVAVRHVLPMGCKERSLCSWALLRTAGAPAVLNVGVELFPLKGHCWCQSGPLTPGDDPEECQQYAVVARYE